MGFAFHAVLVLHYAAMLLHSGEVYMFGNGNHGQLGQGNNKPWFVNYPSTDT